MKRIEGPTPNGGSYAILYYYDKEGKRANEEDAYKCIACEFDENGKLLMETTMISKKHLEDENKNNVNHI